MLIARVMQQVWKKVYFNEDIPKNRNAKCDLKIGTAVFYFLVPTTKQKNSVSQWLGSTNKEVEEFGAWEKF